MAQMYNQQIAKKINKVTDDLILKRRLKTYELNKKYFDKVVLKNKLLIKKNWLDDYNKIWTFNKKEINELNNIYLEQDEKNNKRTDNLFKKAGIELEENIPQENLDLTNLFSEFNEQLKKQEEVFYTDLLNMISKYETSVSQIFIN